VGLPGLMMTRALGRMPSLCADSMAASMEETDVDQLDDSSRWYGIPTPWYCVSAAVYKGYCGMGIRMPDLGDEMSIEMSNETPAEAPDVRKIWLGFAG